MNKSQTVNQNIENKIDSLKTSKVIISKNELESLRRNNALYYQFNKELKEQNTSIKRVNIELSKELIVYEHKIKEIQEALILVKAKLNEALTLADRAVKYE